MTADTGNLPAHSPLGASSAERWMNCSGSVALIEALHAHGGLPEDDPDYRKDGTQAHELGAFCLERGMSAGEAMLEAEWPDLTLEMANAVQVYIDYALSLPGHLNVETRLHRPEFHKLAYGTLDLCAYTISQHWLEVADYKHGEGVVVEIEDNVQVRYYAYLLIAEDREAWPDDMPVKLTICQPRIEHPDGSIRSVMTTAGEIRIWANNELRPAMDRTVGDRFLSLGDWCRFCPAKLICPAMRNLLPEFLSHADVTTLSDEALADLYMKVEQVKMLAKAAAAEVQRRAVDQGKELPGVKVVYARVNRVWKDDAEEKLREALGDVVYTEPKLRSPPDIETVCGDKGKKLVAEYAYKPQGGYTAVPVSDRRKAVKVETAQDRHAALIAYAEAAE